MRVLAAQDRVDLDDLALEVQGFQIMRHGKEVHFRGKLHRGVAPVAVGENAELTRSDELLQTVLHVAEVSRRRERMMRADLLLQLGDGARIGREGAHDVHPVEGRELIEVHDVVVRVERRVHQVADDVRVLRDLDPDRVFDASHGGEGVNARADAADAFDERPGVARIAPLQNHFETAPHGARALRVANHVVFPEHGLHAKVAFDAGDGVHDDTAVFTHSFLPISLLLLPTRACATAESAACAMTAAPTTPAVARPTLSAVASTPPQPGGRIVVSCS